MEESGSEHMMWKSSYWVVAETMQDWDAIEDSLELWEAFEGGKTRQEDRGAVAAAAASEAVEASLAGSTEVVVHGMAA